jgi:hypothetical protein
MYFVFHADHGNDGPYNSLDDALGSVLLAVLEGADITQNGKTSYWNADTQDWDEEVDE